MRINDAFPSNFIKATDLGGRPVKAVIADCRLEELDGENKPVLHFRGKNKGLVLNRINSQMLAGSLGDETDDWIGREIEIYPDRTQFQGRLVDCIRVRVPVPPPPAAGEDDADIPW